MINIFKTKAQEPVIIELTAKEIERHVGGRAKLARTMKGLSQTRLGMRTGVTFQQIQKYEKGVNGMRSSRLYDLSIILGQPVSFFFEGLGEEKTEQLDTDKEIMKIIRAYTKMGEEQRDLLYGITKVIAEIGGGKDDECE